MVGTKLGEEAAPALEVSGGRVLLPYLGHEELRGLPKQRRVRI